MWIGYLIIVSYVKKLNFCVVCYSINISDFSNMVFVGVLFVIVEICVCQDCLLLPFIFLRNFARSFLNSTKFSVVGFLFALLNTLWLSFVAA